MPSSETVTDDGVMAIVQVVAWLCRSTLVTDSRTVQANGSTMSAGTSSSADGMRAWIAAAASASLAAASSPASEISR